MSPLQRWGAFVFPHRTAVLIVWVLATIVLGALSSVGVASLGSSIVDAPGSESAEVLQRLRPMHASGNYVIAVVHAPTGDAVAVEDAAAAVTEIRAMPGVKAAFSYAQGLDVLAAEDGSSFALIAIMDGSQTDSDLVASARPVADRAALVNGSDVSVGGDALVIDETTDFAESDAKRAEMFAIPIALIALILILGGVRVGFVPILVAGTSVAATLASFVLWTQVTDVSVFALNITSLFGIALGVDYGLLLVSRYREELAAGKDPAEAVATTVTTAGRTVIFSAVTVAISLVGLAFFGNTTLTSFAIAGATVTVMVALVSVLVTPAILGSITRHIKPKAPSTAHGWFARTAGFVQKRPGAIVLVVSSTLIFLALPMFHLRTALADERFLPDSSDVRTAVTELRSGYPNLVSDPIAVLADVDAGDPAVVEYIESIKTIPDVVSVAVRPNVDGTTEPIVIDVITNGAGGGDQATQVVHRLRSDRPEFDVAVGGIAAQTIDTAAQIKSGTPLALLWLIGATFILLFLMTGSVLVPIKAIIMNCLALGAAFGVLVWVFQDGHGDFLFGFTAPGVVDIYGPPQVIMFAFGLSMDYEVFLLSRIKEAYDRTGDNTAAVAEGIQRSGAVITAAAFLIVIVFGAAVSGELISVKQFAFVIGLAVILDATVIRMLLVPATMTLMGDWNWWSPKPLRRFHDRFGISEHAPTATDPGTAGSDQAPVPADV